MQLWYFFSKEPKNEFETAVVNESSVFEPLKVYCRKVVTSGLINYIRTF